MGMTYVHKATGTTGLGLMGFTMRPQQTPDDQAFQAMKTAINRGATLWSSASFYGFGDPLANLKLVSRYFKKYPEDAEKVTLYVKGCFSFTGHKPDNSKENVKASVDEALAALDGAKKIDLFGPARGDLEVPIEETAQALKDCITEGKIGGIGLSEVCAASVEKYQSVCPVSLLEVELSLWTRDILQNGVAAVAKKYDIVIAAYSPLGRGFLTGAITKSTVFPEGDFRRHFDRFQEDALAKNLELVEKLKKLAAAKQITPAQLALAWIRTVSDSENCGHIIPVPGATTAQRVMENTEDHRLSNETMAEIEALLDQTKIVGGRYNSNLDLLNCR